MVQVNHSVIVMLEEIRAPIPLQASRIEYIEHALQRRKRDRPAQIHGRWTESTDGLEGLFSLLERAGITPDYYAHLLELVLLREGSRRRYGEKSKPAVEFIGSF